MLSWLWKESFQVLFLCVFKRCKSLHYSLSSFSTFHRNVFSSFFVFNILLHITFTSQFYFSWFPPHFFAFSPIITCSISASFILTFSYDSNLIDSGSFTCHILSPYIFSRIIFLPIRPHLMASNSFTSTSILHLLFRPWYP